MNPASNRTNTGIFLPVHAQFVHFSKFVLEPAVVFGLQRAGVDWHSLDRTYAKIILMIAVPEESAGNEHLIILQMLSRKLMDDSFRNELLSVQSNEDAYKLLETIH